MPAFDELQPASFDGIAYAISRVSVRGGLRDPVHEFPPSPGGKPERLGRKLYTVEMDCIFTTVSQNYPDGWPGDLSDLRDRFEQGVVSDLVIPTIGVIKAYAVDWSQDWVARNRSGETARFVFREDQDDALLADSVVSIQYQSIRPKTDALLALAEAEGIEDLFDSIANLANDIAALQDQVELQGEILAAKVDSLANSCRLLSDTAEELKQPPHHKVLGALHDLGVAAIELNKDILQVLSPTFLFTTPVEMTVDGVARAMYGDTA